MSKIIKLNAHPNDLSNHQDELDKRMFTSTLPVQHTKMYFENEQIGLYVGVWDSTDMQEVAAPAGCDEFMYLISGNAEIRNNNSGLSDTILENEAFVIPKGYDCQWVQKGYIRKFFIISERSEGTASTLSETQNIINLSSYLKHTTTVFNDISEHCKYQPYYTDPNDVFSAGIYKGNSFDSLPCAQPQNQLLFLISGSLVIRDENELAHHFNAGDCFFIPENTVCSWHSSGDFQAFYTTVKNEL